MAAMALVPLVFLCHVFYISTDIPGNKLSIKTIS